MPKLYPERGDYDLWKYSTFIPAAVIFAALYFSITDAVACDFLHDHAFVTGLVNQNIFEIVGCIDRIMSHNTAAKLIPFASQNTLILLASVLFAASIYMTLYGIIPSFDKEKHSFIRAAGIMVIGDLASFGEGVMIRGRAFHIVIFGIFGVTMRRDSTVKSFPASLQWDKFLGMLYASSALIMAQSIFRISEFFMGHDGELMSTEWPLCVFDAVPMDTLMIIFSK
ncbi:hypothetical protein BKA56DRAFT_711360 [Ilyonectria sp. MPI-CAGE-AT-0026]|nr:hypothetical protein BKA56DRAFT_711360 [Ilyonectria sp. MPI-CAGE-AT-0026]